MSSREYYRSHREEILAKSAIYQKDHTEERKRYMKLYCQIHKQEIQISNARYRKEHAEEIREQKRQTYLCKSDTVKASVKRYQQSDAGKVSQRKSSITKRRLEIVSARKTKSPISERQWQNIITIQGNCCAMCGVMFGECTKPTRDHIVPLSSGGLSDAANIQALCISCNTRKGASNPIEMAFNGVLLL